MFAYVSVPNVLTVMMSSAFGCGKTYRDEKQTVEQMLNMAQFQVEKPRSPSNSDITSSATTHQRHTTEPV